jgi:hypothetical protein
MSFIFVDLADSWKKLLELIILNPLQGPPFQMPEVCIQAVVGPG